MNAVWSSRPVAGNVTSPVLTVLFWAAELLKIPALPTASNRERTALVPQRRLTTQLEPEQTVSRGAVVVEWNGRVDEVRGSVLVQFGVAKAGQHAQPVVELTATVDLRVVQLRSIGPLIASPETVKTGTAAFTRSRSPGVVVVSDVANETTSDHSVHGAEIRVAASNRQARPGRV